MCHAPRLAAHQCSRCCGSCALLILIRHVSPSILPLLMPHPGYERCDDGILISIAPGSQSVYMYHAESSESAPRTKGAVQLFSMLGDRQNGWESRWVCACASVCECECVSPSGNNAILFKSHFAAGALVGLPSSSSGDLSFPHSLSLTK